MRFPVPFGYECTVVTSGGNHVDRRYREIVEIEVSEFEPGELPVVLSWRGHRGEAGEGGRVDALHHAGGLYEAVTARRFVDGAWARFPVRAGDALAAVADAMAKKPFEHGDLHIRDIFLSEDVRKVFGEDQPYLHKGPPKPATIARRYGNDKRDGALERVLNWGDRFVSVGGVLHRRVPEPVLIAAPEGLSLQPEPEAGKGVRVFRLDDAELALERARIVAKDRKAEIRPPDFVLRRPDLLGREVEDAALHGTVRGLLGFVHIRLATASLATMESYCDLREAFTPHFESYAERREPDPAELVRLGRVLVDRVREDHPDERVVAEEAVHGLDRAEARLVPAAGPAPR
jgi:hypothetical protein